METSKYGGNYPRVRYSLLETDNRAGETDITGALLGHQLTNKIVKNIVFYP